MSILQWEGLECLNPPDGYDISVYPYPFSTDRYGYAVSPVPRCHLENTIFLSRGYYPTANECKEQCERDLIALGILKESLAPFKTIKELWDDCLYLGSPFGQKDTNGTGETHDSLKPRDDNP